MSETTARISKKSSKWFPAMRVAPGHQMLVARVVVALHVDNVSLAIHLDGFHWIHPRDKRHEQHGGQIQLVRIVGRARSSLHLGWQTKRAVKVPLAIQIHEGGRVGGHKAHMHARGGHVGRCALGEQRKTLHNLPSGAVACHGDQLQLQGRERGLV